MHPSRILLFPRRWFQLRLRTVFLLATALCIYLAWPHLARQYAFWQLRGFGELHRYDVSQFEGRNRHGSVVLLSNSRIERLLSRLIIQRDSFPFLGRSPDEVLSIVPANRGHVRLLVVQRSGWFIMPGENLLRATMYDRLGRMIADRDITIPSRMWATKLRYDAASHSFPCLEVVCVHHAPIAFSNDSARIHFGSHTQRQFFAIHGDRLTFVRVTDEFGGNWADSHAAKVYHGLGGAHRFGSLAAWSQALMSSDTIHILEALLHLPPKEAVEERDLANIERLQALSQSNDVWIRDGATAALAEFEKLQD